MKQPTVALAMIVKGDKSEADHLRNCLGNISSFVDSIYIDFNSPDGHIDAELVQIARDYNSDYTENVWTGDFAGARNTNFNRVDEKYDWVLWLDADDTVDKPEEIRKIIAVASKSVHGIFVKYDYGHDEYGNVTISHYVARLVRNDKSYAWKSSISDGEVSVHETLNEIIPLGKAVCDDFVIVHHADSERATSSLYRNIELLEKMYEEQVTNKKVDPRTLYYLATHYYDAYLFGDAKNLLQQYMTMSGWNEERAGALTYLGKIYDMEKKPDQAKHAYLLALGENQNDPHPYIELSELEYRNGRYQDSADWSEKAIALPPPKTTMVLRPLENTFRAYLLAAQAYTNVGGKMLDKALQRAQDALKLRPLDNDAKNAQDLIEKLIEQRENIRAAVRLVNIFKNTKHEENIIPLIDSLPREVQDNPLILNTRHQYARPQVWKKNTIALFVGQGPLGIWDSTSIDSGIGGSEEAVIRLSRELSDLGWQVTIFGTPKDDYVERKIHDKRFIVPASDPDIKDNDIIWKQYYEFNPKDTYNVLISWRNPAFFDFNFKARKKYLWLHDIMEKAEFTKERLANLDKVIFVGQYHAEYYEGVIPEDKWFVSGNGISPEDFEAIDKKKLKRQKHRLIYMSAHNRGLEILLDNWEKIKKEVPDAVLDIYYGWESFDAAHRDNPERMAWKQKIVRQTNELSDVTDHGRISQERIVKEIATADILAYPCIFPEVYCITYAKALAGGAYPVASDYAELGNYIVGAQVHYEEGDIDKFAEDYIKELIDILKTDYTDSVDRTTIMQQSRRAFSWTNTANEWSEEMK